MRIMPKEIVTLSDLRECKLDKILTTKNLYRINQLFNQIELHSKAVTNTPLHFEIEDKFTWIKLLAYMYKSIPLCNYLGINIKKGICLNGPIGCGKTTTFKIMQRMISSEDYFAIRSCKRTALEFSVNGFQTIHYLTSKSFLGNQHILLDDLGSELKINFFGTNCNIFQEVISLRYDLFTENKIKTHFTTNYSASDLEKLYGPRVRSRLRSMVNIFAHPVKAIDKRK